MQTWGQGRKGHFRVSLRSWRRKLDDSILLNHDELHVMEEISAQWPRCLYSLHKTTAHFSETPGGIGRKQWQSCSAQ